MADLGSPAIIGGGSGAVTEAEETAINAALGNATAENPAVAGNDPTRDVTIKSATAEDITGTANVQGGVVTATEQPSGDQSKLYGDGTLLGPTYQIDPEMFEGLEAANPSAEAPPALTTDSRFPTVAAAAALAANTDLSATNPVGDRATSVGPWVLGRAYSFPMLVVSQTNNGFFLSTDTPTAHTATADDEPGEGENSAAHWLQIGQLTTAAEVSNIPTTNQKASLAGTSGTAPSGENKLVDNADSRMTNARTPSAHAASHLTGADQIADATAEAHGLMTAAHFSKIDGVEAGANVTDAENVAAAGAVMTSDVVVKQSIATLPNAADVTPDFATSNNFELALLTATGASRNLKNPSNPTIGQAGIIYLVQDGAGSLAIVFDTYYKFAGGVKPGLSTAASAVDRLVYFVRSATFIDCQLVAGIA